MTVTDGDRAKIIEVLEKIKNIRNMVAFDPKSTVPSIGELIGYCEDMRASEEGRAQEFFRRLGEIGRNAMEKAQKGEVQSTLIFLDRMSWECAEYLGIEERFVGYAREDNQLGSVEKQAKLLSDMFGGITTHQAMKMLTIAFESGLDVVIGGSTFKNFRLGSDLDVGFKKSKGSSVVDLGSTVKTVVNKINKECFKSFLSEKKPLIEHKWIYDKSTPKLIPKIETVEDFFMRVGVRGEEKIVEKSGKPFGPSGCAVFRRDGSVSVIKPVIKESIVGLPRFW